MGQVVLPGDPPISVVLRRSAQARRLSLRVSRLDGRVTLSLPNWTADREAIAFAREKEAWIRKNLQSWVPVRAPELGGRIQFRGQDVGIVPTSQRSVQVANGQMFVPGPEDRVPARIAAFLKMTARQELVRASDDYAGRIGHTFSRVTLRDTRSRWGSCTTDGNLMYSWRLIMAPPEVLNYVAAHEVSHLAEMNHSPRFWAVVARVCPDYREHRAWLRNNGSTLHGYRFGN